MPVTVKELLDQARTALATEQEESGPIDVVKEADVRLALPHSRTTGTGLLIITCAPKHHDSKLLSHKMSTPAVGLDDLNYGVNRGKYLTGSITSETTEASSVSVIFTDDKTQRKAVLSIYNCEASLLKTCTQVGIMEPLIKRREDGMPVIRIDSPYDIRGVPARPHSQPGDGVSFGDKEPLAAHRHPLLDKLREDARVRYAKGDALGAVRRWQLALGYAQSNDDRALLMLNMALAHLRPDLNRPGEAMRLLEIVHCYEAEDRGPVLHTTEQRTKLYHRSAVAAYRLRRWPDATKWAKELSPSLREPLLAQLAAREAEYTNGSYDWLAIWNQLKAGEELDIADYRNPQVAVENIAGRGRGVVAQATLQAGTLLLVERPVAFTKPNPDRSAARLVGLNLATEVLMPPAQTALVKAAFMAANDNADRCEDLHDLYAGPNFPQPPTNGDRVRYRDTPLDAGWVEGAVVYNSFRVRCVTSPIGGVVKKGNDEDEEDDDGPSALYHFASMANHSCSPNATYCFFGSRFVMRTLRRITEGDEITISYVDQAANLIDRRQALKHHFPPEVVCSCALCETDAKTEYERRRQLLGAAKPFESHSAEALRKLFQRVARTYAVHPSSRSMPHDFMPELYPVGLARLRKLTSSDRYDLATMLLQIIGAYPSAEETTFTLFNVASILTIMTVAILSEKHPECSADISSSEYRRYAEGAHELIVGPGLFDAHLGRTVADLRRTL